MTPEEVAERYAFSRTGFDLVAFEEVALPHYWLSLEALVQLRKKIPPIEEFVLASVNAGLTRLDDMAGFLGLNPRLVRHATEKQWREDHLDLVPDSEGLGRVLRLTNIGRQVLDELVSVTPQREEISFAFDRTLWAPVAVRRAELEKYPEDLPRVPARRSRRPSLKDLSVERVGAVFSRPRADYQTDADLLSLKSLDRAEKWYRRGVLLVYRSPSDQRAELGLALDGRLSTHHGIALAEVKAIERMKIVETLGRPADVPDQVNDLLKTAPPQESIRQLQERVSSAKAVIEAETQRTSARDSAESREVAESKAAADAARRELEKVQSELAAVRVRRVQVYEHAELLREAMNEAKSRLLIISPWIRAKVVNRDFVRRLERLCQSGIPIHIAWGFGEDKDEVEHDRRAKGDLQDLSARYESFTFRNLGNTHAKVLIWDGNWVVGSFNWLSFRGDPERTFRQEEGVLVTIKEQVDKYYRQFRDEIETAP